MKFASIFVLIASYLPLTSGQQCPFGPSDLVYGATLEMDENITKRVLLERKGNQCPCSYTETTCKLKDGSDCSNIVVDASAAIADPSAFVYPEVKVFYTLKLCNYNSYNMFFAPLNKDGEPRNEISFWYTRPNQLGNTQRIYLAEGRYSNDELKAGECKTLNGKTRLPTNIARYYMKALLNGPHEDGFATGFCNAFSFNPIEIAYDYGDGICDVSTKATCVVKGTNISCEDYIKNMNLSSCENPETFTGVFGWEACNNNDRMIYLNTVASKRKYNKNELDSKGKYIRDTEPLPSTIDANSCYAPAPVEKEINPCSTNFSQVNLKGLQYNRETGLHFRDKDCSSFTFLGLPRIDPSTLVSSSPTDSTLPSMSPVQVIGDSTASPSTLVSNPPTVSTSPTMSPVKVVEDTTASPSTTVSNPPTVSTSPTMSPVKVVGDTTASPSVTSSSYPSPVPSVRPSRGPTNPPNTAGAGDSTAGPSVPITSAPSVKITSAPSVKVTPNPTPLPTKSPKKTKAPHTMKSPKATQSPGTKAPKSTKSPKLEATKSPKDPKSTKSPKSSLPDGATNSPKNPALMTKSPKSTKSPGSTKTPKASKSPKATKSPHASTKKGPKGL